jgi:ribosomal-protein-alanine N-acetyltransferase
MEYFLTSSRLGFRRWTTEDLPLAAQLWGDPSVTGLFGGPYTPEAVRARLELEMRQARKSGVQYWPVFLLENAEHVGCAGLRPCSGPRTLELGFHLRPRFWGKGIATEAARAIVRYGFEVLDLDAIFAGHHPSNTASRNVLVKLGFARTGEEFYPPSGVVEPTYLLSKADWQSETK